MVSDSLNDSLDNINSLKKYKSYFGLHHLGLTLEDVVDITAIARLLPYGSYIQMSVNSTERDHLFNTNVIPVNATGILKITNASARGMAEFFAESNGYEKHYYFRKVSNCGLTTETSWTPWYVIEGIEVTT